MTVDFEPHRLRLWMSADSSWEVGWQQQQGTRQCVQRNRCRQIVQKAYFSAAAFSSAPHGIHLIGTRSVIRAAPVDAGLYTGGPPVFVSLAHSWTISAVPWRSIVPQAHYGVIYLCTSYSVDSTVLCLH